MPSDSEKIRVYESFLHSIQMYHDVVLDKEKVGRLIRNACNWSYAHRVGNGEITNESQDKLILKAFHDLDRVNIDDNY